MTTVRILITGATGNIGSQLVKQLAQYDVILRAGAHTRAADESLPNIEYVPLDFMQTDTLQAAMTGMDKVFLLTPNAPNAIEMAKNAILVAKETNIQHVVRLSAYHDVETIENPHRIVEDLITDSGLTYTYLRPGPFMQNFIYAFGPTIRTQSALYEPLEDARVSYIDARDIARVAAVILTETGHENRAYHLTGPEALSNHDIAAILSEVTGRTIQYINIPEEAARASLKNMNMPDPVVESIIGLYALMRAGKRAQVTHHIESITRQAATSFKAFAQDYTAAFSEEVRN